MLTSLSAASRRAVRRYPFRPAVASSRRWFSALVEDSADEEMATAVSDENDLSKFLRPSEIVKKLDDYVVGQQVRRFSHVL